MRGISICLAPCTEDAQRLDAAIHAHAALTGRTPFSAHLTLASRQAESAGLDGALSALSAIAQRHKPLLLEPFGFLETERFTRSFALRYAPSDELDALRADVLNALGKDDDEFLPHVSLTYGAPPDRARLEAAAMALAAPIKFDALIVLGYAMPIQSQADVAGWTYSPRIALSSPL